MPCTACSLSCKGKLNASKGWGNPNAKLIIFLDAPGDHLSEKLLIWIIRKLSLRESDVWIDYLFKCPLPSGKQKKVNAQDWAAKCDTAHPHTSVEGEIVLAGNWSAEILGGAKMKDWHGRKEPETGCWIIYSFAYLLMNPAECVDAWRVIYTAAKDAGLNPKMDMSVEIFKFPSKKVR